MYYSDNPQRGFTKRTLAALHLLAKSPLADQEIARVEASDVAQRAALAERLAAMPAHHTKAIAALHRKAIESAAALERAKQQLAGAIAADAAAQVEFSSAASALDRAATDIRMELEKSADPRLAAFAWAAMELRDHRVRHVTSPDTFVAMEALMWAHRQALALRLVPLTFAEVTTELTSIASAIRGPLAAVDAEPPAIENDDNVVMH